MLKVEERIDRRGKSKDMKRVNERGDRTLSKVKIDGGEERGKRDQTWRECKERSEGHKHTFQEAMGNKVSEGGRNLQRADISAIAMKEESDLRGERETKELHP